MGTRLINRAERLAAIPRLLLRSTGGLRAVEIAEACEVDRRTIYRDLNTLVETGVPIFQRDGRFYLDRSYLPALNLNLNEAATLLLALRILIHHQEQTNPHLTSVLEKLSLFLPVQAAENALALAHITAHQPGDAIYTGILETIVAAWGACRVVKLWDNRGAREFAPYILEILPTGSVYAVGLDIQAQKMRVLKVRRLKRAKLLAMTYVVPPGFDSRKYLAGMVFNDDDLEEILLLFPLEMMPTVRQRALPNAQFDPLGEQHFLLRLRVADWRGMIPWIRGWGEKVEVLSPQVLRESLAGGGVSQVGE